MTLKKVAALSASAVAMAAMVGTAQAHDGKYLQDSYGNAVKDSYGKCVKAAYGNMLDGCEPKKVTPPPPPPPPKPIVRPAPKPKPIVKPRPRPRPAPAPMPAPKPMVQKMTLSADANFDFDKAVLKPAGKAKLDQFAAGLRGSKVNAVSVVGHTDSIGSKAYNQRLSEQRASAAANYLISKGIPQGVMRVKGMGETQPVASNKTKAGRAANRRVDVTATGTRTYMK